MAAVVGQIPTAAEIADWTVAAGLRESRLEPVVSGFVDRLSAAIPGLARTLIGAPTLHPRIASGTWTWQRGGPVEAERFGFDNELTEDWLASPIFHALQTGEQRIRADLTDPEQVARFPIFETFAAGAHTDYLLRMLPFEDGTPASGLEGMIVTFLSDSPAGFSRPDIATIESVLPALGLAVFRLGISEVARNLLAAYLGPDAGRRVLGGRVRRGDVERIEAAVLFADLRHYTDISERRPPDAMVAWLNAGLSALGDPASRHGGQILKFLGDGLLAIFPTEGGESGACRRALASARESLQALAALNGDGPTEDAYEADIALHVGEVAYGNIGASDRLDFTVIGPTVNEVSRMESLCDALGVHLLMSESFVRQAAVPARDLGLHRLRGLVAPRRLLTLTES